MLKGILTIFLFAFVCLVLRAASSQDTVVTKAYLNSLESRIQVLESSSGVSELTKERVGLINDKVENLENEIDRSAAGVSNQLAASSNYLTVWSVIFAIVGIGIAAYINSQQNKSAKNLEENKHILELNKVVLEESRGILELQKLAKNEVLEIQKLINENLTDLYNKLQAEEVNFLIDQINKNPNLMYQLFDRFLVLKLNEDHFRRLANFVIEPIQKHDGIGASSSVFTIILNHFPIIWLKDKGLKAYFIKTNHWIKIIGNYEYNNLQTLVDNFCLHIKDTVPDELDFRVVSAILECAHNLSEEIRKNYSPPELRIYDPDRELTKYIYKNLQKKELRFGLYDILSSYSTGKLFWDMLYAEYSNDSTNTPEQIEILYRCKDVYSNHSNKA